MHKDYNVVLWCSYVNHFLKTEDGKTEVANSIDLNVRRR